MSNAYLDGTNIDLSVFSYSAPKPNASGGKVVNLYNKHAKEYLTISVPLISAWGATEGRNDGGVLNGKYTMDLQFSKGQYTSPDTDKFLEQLKLLENKVKEDAIVYSREWFGKEIKSMEVMEEKFNSMLKYRKITGSEMRDYDSPPTLRVKLPCWNKVWQTSVFDEDFNPLYVKGKSAPGVTPLDFLVTTSRAPIQVIALIQSAGIWIANGKASITWNFKQVVLRKPKVSSISDDTCFLKVSNPDVEALKSAPQHEMPQDDATVSAMVEDSDGEEEYKLPPPTPAPAPAPAPAPTPTPTPTPVVETPPVVVTEEPKKKKVISKKKVDA